MISTKSNPVLIGSVISLGMLLLFSRTSRSLTTTSTTKVLSQEQQAVLSLIMTTLTQAGLNEATARYWTAVSALETGFWTSNVFNQNRNLWGMRKPSSNTTAIGSNLGFAVYSSVADSAKDLPLYFARLKWKQLNFDSLEQLIGYMKSKGYFEETLQYYGNAAANFYKALYV